MENWVTFIWQCRDRTGRIWEIIVGNLQSRLNVLDANIIILFISKMYMFTNQLTEIVMNTCVWTCIISAYVCRSNSYWFHGKYYWKEISAFALVVYSWKWSKLINYLLFHPGYTRIYHRLLSLTVFSLTICGIFQHFFFIFLIKTNLNFSHLTVAGVNASKNWTEKVWLLYKEKLPEVLFVCVYVCVRACVCVCVGI